ncbi:MAG TPA: hypothetical protein ENK18_23860 [Deltaproteobacteria bacterium]|nr:hypothetical protein [Deltaproteobacteria bacterium]
MDIVAQDQDRGLALQRVQIPVEVVWLDGCDGTPERLEIDRLFDGLEPDLEPIVVPGGTWCTIELGLSAPIVVQGVTASGTTFEASLAAGGLAQRGPFEIDGEALLFSIDLPIHAGQIDSLGITGVVVEADDPLALAWVDSLEAGLSLWVDADGDGRLASGDRYLAPPAQALSGEAGCGCRSAPGTTGWLGLLGLGLGLGLRLRLRLRRARRRAR